MSLRPLHSNVTVPASIAVTVPVAIASPTPITLPPSTARRASRLTMTTPSRSSGGSSPAQRPAGASPGAPEVGPVHDDGYSKATNACRTSPPRT